MLGAKLEPCWPPFSAKDHPRGLQDPSKTPPRRFQDSPRCLQRRFGSRKTAQDASKPALEPSRPRCFTMFDWFLVHLWFIFDWFWIDVSLNFNMKKQNISTSKKQKQTLKRWYIAQLLCYFAAGAVAGSQLCCALDPPRQSEGLRLAYRIPYPNHRPTCLSFLYPS